MTIKVVNFTDTPTLFKNLEELALSKSDIVFRGHRDASWHVESTLARYTSMPMRSYVKDLEEDLLYFMYKISSISEVPFKFLARRAVLEFARHHGIATPVIDFTWSPYVALYFAFGGMQWKYNSEPKNASVIAVNLYGLSHGWAKLFEQDDSKAMDFLLEDQEFFAHGYPIDTMKFIRFPASWNRRMQSQQGCFLYDAIDYASSGLSSGFEGFVEKIDEFGDADSNDKYTTMTKFLAPHSVVGDVLERLEMTNINGINLLDHDGIASDVMSTYNHNRKIEYNWDMKLE